MEHDPAMIVIGVILFVGMQAGLILLIVRHRRGNRAAARAMEVERQSSWLATVTGSEAKEVTVQSARGGPMAGRYRKANLLTVTYHRDDGVDGHVLQYEGEIMNEFYSGALAYYVHAPAYDELRRWRPGDRLLKPPGAYFPSLVREPLR